MIEEDDADSESRSRIILEELERQSQLVPDLGQGSRWYDPTWRALDKVLFSTKWRWKLPLAFQTQVNKLWSFFQAINEVERMRIGWPGDQMRQIVVPEGENVAIPGMWVVELYSASHVGSLQRRLTRRDWKHANWTWDRLHPARSLQRSRRRPQAYGWERIVRLTAIGQLRGDFDAIPTRLPREFRSVDLYSVPIGSSLTAVVASITFTDHASGSVDRVLRNDHQPRLRRMGPTIQANEPLFVGLQSVMEERARLHRLGRDWLAREMPGVFAKEGNKHHPVVDLVLTTVHDPLGMDDDQARSNFLRALALGSNEFDVDYIHEVAGVRLVDNSPSEQFLSGREEFRRKDSLVAKFDVALGEDAFVGSYGPRSPAAIFHRLDRRLVGLVARLALTHLLELKFERAAEARDLAAQTHRARPVRSARKLRNSILIHSIDLATIASDIKRLTSRHEVYEWNIPQIHRKAGKWRTNPETGRRPRKVSREVLRLMAERQAELAEELERTDSALLQLLGVVANLNSSIESIRVQRVAIVISLLSFVAAAAAVYFTLV